MAIRATCGWIMVHIKKTHTAPATARSACCTCGVSTKRRSLLLGQGKAASSAGWGAVRSQKDGTSAHIRRPRPPPPRAPPRLVALQLAGLLQCRGALLARSLALLLPAPSRRRPGRSWQTPPAGCGATRPWIDVSVFCSGVLVWRSLPEATAIANHEIQLCGSWYFPQILIDIKLDPNWKLFERKWNLFSF